MGRIEVVGAPSKISGTYIDYSFADGPYEGRVAFSIRKELMSKLSFENREELYGACVKGDGDKQVIFDGFKIVEHKPKNAAIIKTSCGESMSMTLEDISEDQPITEVTIRGKKYVPA